MTVCPPIAVPGTVHVRAHRAVVGLDLDRAAYVHKYRFELEEYLLISVEGTVENPRRRSGDNARLSCVSRELGDALDAKFLLDAELVELDRFDGDSEHGRNLLVAPPLR
jgi:hypothetical protein